MPVLRVCGGLTACWVAPRGTLSAFPEGNPCLAHRQHTRATSLDIPSGVAGTLLYHTAQTKGVPARAMLTAAVRAPGGSRAQAPSPGCGAQGRSPRPVSVLGVHGPPIEISEAAARFSGLLRVSRHGKTHRTSTDQRGVLRPRGCSRRHSGKYGTPPVRAI